MFGNLIDGCVAGLIVGVILVAIFFYANARVHRDKEKRS
jgi:hypothetical protein